MMVVFTGMLRRSSVFPSWGTLSCVVMTTSTTIMSAFLCNSFFFLSSGFFFSSSPPLVPGGLPQQPDPCVT